MCGAPGESKLGNLRERPDLDGWNFCQANPSHRPMTIHRIDQSQGKRGGDLAAVTGQG